MTIKTANAKRVLQLMDSVEDGDSRYNEFVLLVSNESGNSVSKIEKELENWI